MITTLGHDTSPLSVTSSVSPGTSEEFVPPDTISTVVLPSSNPHIPVITVTDCSEPVCDSLDLCLLCDSPDHVTLVCPLCKTTKGYAAARKRGLCYLCLADSFNQSHCCIPHNVCLAQLCSIKPLHSSALCGSASTDLSGCFMLSSTKERTFKVNRLQTLILWFFDPLNKTLEPVRCLADTGASHSFLAAKKAKTLNLPTIETKRMSI